MLTSFPWNELRSKVLIRTAEPFNTRLFDSHACPVSPKKLLSSCFWHFCISQCSNFAYHGDVLSPDLFSRSRRRGTSRSDLPKLHSFAPSLLRFLLLPPLYTLYVTFYLLLSAAYKPLPRDYQGRRVNLPYTYVVLTPKVPSFSADVTRTMCGKLNRLSCN